MSGKMSGIVLVAQPGRMRASLWVLLKSLYPRILIEQTENAATALVRLAVDQPWLVLVDADLPDDEGWRLGTELRLSVPGHQPLMLVHTVSQNDRARQAGLDAIFLEGMTSESLSKGVGVYVKG
jgi:DNA-binding NarL/FixJ family response regulator